ncbi:hypothetical protein ANCCAN_18314 [Ancylostoma caninum]|uniref:Uncharacterized protein n=1 Tax=Ancylostoma caninum TaxID=29170 RepID=A0A368FUB6_ANCCA|nr:hypothetical protein ANCCAN_18314 [Ancylostoma caninum]
MLPCTHNNYVQKNSADLFAQSPTLATAAAEFTTSPSLTNITTTTPPLKINIVLEPDATTTPTLQ